MLEIRFHGRGGQGTVVASILLANAFFKAGYYVQSFPLFGVERRGAPVEAYLRLDKQEILIRTNVYHPDHVVVMDRSILQAVDVSKGMKKGGYILINAPAVPKGDHWNSAFRPAWVDATRIARDNGLGTRTHPILNTAMMGAFARVLGMPPMEAVVKAIQEEVPDQVEKNVQAAKDAYLAVEGFEI